MKIKIFILSIIIALCSISNLSSESLCNFINDYDDLYNTKDYRKAISGDKNLYRANLTEATLFNLQLDKVDLREARLVRTNLKLSSLREANLSGADLSGAYFYQADLFKAIVNRKWFDYLRNQNVKNFYSIIWVN